MTPAASLRDRYQWRDLSSMRTKKPDTPTVTTSNPITDPGWTDHDIAKGDGGNGPSGPGISPQTAGMLGTALQFGGMVSGNQSMSQAGGLLGIAGSENPGAAMAASAASMAGGRYGGVLGGAVYGAITGGVPGAVQGAVTGGVLSALGPIGVVLAVGSLLDGWLNEGKLTKEATDTVKGFFADAFNPQPWGEGKANLSIGAPAVSPQPKDAQAAIDSTTMNGVPAGSTPASTGAISSNVTATVDPAQAAQSAPATALTPEQQTALSNVTIDNNPASNMIAAPASTVDQTPSIAPESATVAPSSTAPGSGWTESSYTIAADTAVPVAQTVTVAPTADYGGYGGGAGDDRGSFGGGYGTGGDAGGFGPQ